MPKIVFNKAITNVLRIVPINPRIHILMSLIFLTFSFYFFHLLSCHVLVLRNFYLTCHNFFLRSQTVFYSVEFFKTHVLSFSSNRVKHQSCSCRLVKPNITPPIGPIKKPQSVCACNFHLLFLDIFLHDENAYSSLSITPMSTYHLIWSFL